MVAVIRKKRLACQFKCTIAFNLISFVPCLKQRDILISQPVKLFCCHRASHACAQIVMQGGHVRLAMLGSPNLLVGAAP